MDGENLPSEGRRLSAIAVRETIKYLNSKHYTVRLIPLTDGEAPVVVRTYDRQGIVNAVGFLRHANFGYYKAEEERHAGYHVFFRPEGNHFVFVDDVCDDGIDQMIVDRINPTLVTETSEGNFQAWVQIANKSNQVTPDEATICRRILAERYDGDTGATGRNQLGRLPGFYNRKPKYETGIGKFPLVKIKKSRFISCAASLLAEVRERLAENPPPLSPHGECAHANTLKTGCIDSSNSSLTIDEAIEIYDAELDYQMDRLKISKPLVRGYRSTIDFEIARGLSHRCGIPNGDIATILFYGSEKAGERGNDYVVRTVSAAYRNVPL